jgi:hypothetical protein
MDCQKIKAAIDTASRFEPLSETTQRHMRSCGGCREYADEMSSLLSLLQSSPRVTAPADFDFRLRARIATAQAKRRSPFSFLEGFWSLPFSWGQTATAMATIALVATLATFYFVRQTPIDNELPSQVAYVTPAPKQAPSSSISNTPSDAARQAPTTVAAAVSSQMPSQSVKNVARPAVLKQRIEETEATGAESAEMAVTQIMVRSRDGAPRVITVSDVTYGAQPAVARAENTVAANQIIF